MGLQKKKKKSPKKQQTDENTTQNIHFWTSFFTLVISHQPKLWSRDRLNPSWEDIRDGQGNGALPLDKTLHRTQAHST